VPDEHTPMRQSIDPPKSKGASATRSPRMRRLLALGFSVVASFLALLTFRAFDPGFMTPDSLTQYLQAIGSEPITDWHPPVLTLLWRFLMSVTAQPSSMLALQLAVYWGSLLSIALVLLRRSGSRRWALATLGIGLVPNLLNFSGVIWKDVHLALALLATVALSMLASEFPRNRPLRWVLIALSVILLAYATLVRRNAIIALPPIMYALYSGLTVGSRRRPQHLAGLVFAVALVAGAGQIAITTLIKPLQGNQLASIAVDDIVHVSTADDIKASSLSLDLQRRLLQARVDCADEHILMNSYLNCYDYSPTGPVPVPNADKLQAAWPRLMLEEPAAYVAYRTRVFVELVAQPRYFWADGVMKNSEGLEVAHPTLSEHMHRYVVGVGVGKFGFLFNGVTWSVGALYLIFGRRRGQNGTLVRCLGLSALLYILGYWPFAPANDYRYFYWSAFAVVVGLVLASHDRYAMGAAVEPPSHPSAGVWLNWLRRKTASVAKSFRIPLRGHSVLPERTERSPGHSQVLVSDTNPESNPSS